jgi:hypothetical protein
LEKMDPLRVSTLGQRPDLEPKVSSLDPAAFPEFMHHDMAVNRYWGRLYADFADFQIVLCTGQEVVAAGNTIPVFWDGTIAGLPAVWTERSNGGFRTSSAAVPQR